MAKSLDSMFEMIRSAKHPFKQVADRPDKPHKNRYERRKVKHLLHLADWAEQAPARVQARQAQVPAPPRQSAPQVFHRRSWAAGPSETGRKPRPTKTMRIGLKPGL